MENASTSPVSSSAVGVRYGLIAGVSAIIISLITYNLQNGIESPVRYLVYVMLVVSIVLAHKYFKEHNDSFLSYGQGLGIGTVVGAITGLLSGLFSYVYVTFVDTGYMGRVLTAARTKMEADGKASAEAIDVSISWMQKFMSGPMILATTLIWLTLVGFIFSLIISAFTKHNRPEFE